MLVILSTQGELSQKQRVYAKQHSWGILSGCRGLKPRDQHKTFTHKFASKRPMFFHSHQLSYQILISCSFCQVSHKTLRPSPPSFSSILWQKSDHTDSFYLSFQFKSTPTDLVMGTKSLPVQTMNQYSIRYYFELAQPSSHLDFQCVSWVISSRAHLAAKLQSRS